MAGVHVVTTVAIMITTVGFVLWIGGRAHWWGCVSCRASRTFRRSRRRAEAALAERQRGDDCRFSLAGLVKRMRTP